MCYELILAPEAIRDVERVPVYLLDYLESQLGRLAEAPASLSRPSVSPPYPPRCQMWEFSAPTLDGIYRFTVLFRYTQDEKHLSILGIGHGELIAPSPGEEEL